MKTREPCSTCSKSQFIAFFAIGEKEDGTIEGRLCPICLDKIRYKKSIRVEQLHLLSVATAKEYLAELDKAKTDKIKKPEPVQELEVIQEPEEELADGSSE